MFHMITRLNPDHSQVQFDDDSLIRAYNQSALARCEASVMWLSQNAFLELYATPVTPFFMH